MTVAQDESTLDQAIDEKMSLIDQQQEVLKKEEEEVSTSSSAGSSSAMVCTAESCSIPLHDGSQSNGGSHPKPSEEEEEKDSKGLSDPMVAGGNNKKNNKRRNNKNKGGGQSVSSSIQQIHTQSDLNKVLQHHDTVLLEFVTTWCTACHGIQPLYEELAQREITMNGGDEAGNDSMLLLRATQVVCDKNKETKKLADANGVGSYPVFVLFENGKEVNKWKGADVGKLEKAFDHYGGGGAVGGKRGKGGKGKKGKGRR